MTEQGAAEAGPRFVAALVAEVAKRTGVCWIGYGGQVHAVWHLWHEDALCLVSGGDEQPLPGIADVDLVEVTMRSKDNGGRLVTWVGRVCVVRPGDERWPSVTAALVTDRLNLSDLDTAATRWAEHSVVTRIVATGELTEAPGALSDGAHRAVPLPTTATTRDPAPAARVSRPRRRRFRRRR